MPWRRVWCARARASPAVSAPNGTPSTWKTPQERPGRIQPQDSDALRGNIQLAESLGATVVRVKAERPADGLIAFAQREGITHVIFGQSARSRWELLWRGSTIDRFLGAVRDAAVQVVALDDL